MALIGISGKIGSGKDLIGWIIQYLVCLKNDTLAKSQQEFSYFQLAPQSNELQSGWKIKKFAGKLKEICSILTGIPIEDFEKQEVKDRVLGEEWRTHIATDDYTTYHLQKSVHAGYREEKSTIYTVRELLQKVGTDAMRNVIHPNIWVNALFADYKLKVNLPQVRRRNLTASRAMREHSSALDNAQFPNWIITDTRFPNEADAIKSRGGLLIRVNRHTACSVGIKVHMELEEKITGTLTVNHPSETALDNYQFDYVIDNNGTIGELIEKVKLILIERKII